jgi:hypothetical protein
MREGKVNQMDTVKLRLGATSLQWDEFVSRLLAIRGYRLECHEGLDEWCCLSNTIERAVEDWLKVHGESIHAS